MTFHRNHALDLLLSLDLLPGLINSMADKVDATTGRGLFAFYLPSFRGWLGIKSWANIDTGHRHGFHKEFLLTKRSLWKVGLFL